MENDHLTEVFSYRRAFNPEECAAIRRIAKSQPEADVDVYCFQVAGTVGVVIVVGLLALWQFLSRVPTGKEGQERIAFTSRRGGVSAACLALGLALSP